MEVRGRGVVVQGTRTNGVWNWNACQFNFGEAKGTLRNDAKTDRTGSEPKTVTVIDQNVEEPVFSPVEKKSFWGKTADFATRTAAGAAGAAIPFAAAIGVKYLANGALPSKPEQFYELGLFTAGIGLASATFTSEPEAALTRGMQFGSVVVLTQALGGYGEGKAWETTRDGVEKTAEKVKDAASSASAKAGEKWSNLKDWTAANIKDPTCKWSNGGYAGKLFGCAAPEKPPEPAAPGSEAPKV